MILSALLFGIPTLIFLLITVLIYLPFYPLDKILGRKNNGNAE
jgi:cellobiose-specific phosphotransferase system component IIC